MDIGKSVCEFLGMGSWNLISFAKKYEIVSTQPVVVSAQRLSHQLPPQTANSF